MEVYAGRRTGATALLVAVLTVASGCFGGSAPSPPGYTLTVNASTRGMHPDPDGYTVSVDGGPGRAVDANGRVAFSGLSGSDHWVGVWRQTIASNCQVNGNNPQSVRMWDTDYWGNTDTTDQTVTIPILCDWNATLRVTVATTGPNPPTSYFLAMSSPWIDDPWGLGGWSVDANGTAVFARLPAGETTLRLTPGTVPANCAVTGENPRTVSLVHNQEIETVFEVNCT